MGIKPIGYKVRKGVIIWKLYSSGFQEFCEDGENLPWSCLIDN